MPKITVDAVKCVLWITIKLCVDAMMDTLSIHSTWPNAMVSANRKTLYLSLTVIQAVQAMLLDKAQGKPFLMTILSCTILIF